MNNLDLLIFINSRPHFKPSSSIAHHHHTGASALNWEQLNHLDCAQATVMLLKFIKLELRCNLDAQVVRFPLALKWACGVFMLISRLCRQIEFKTLSCRAIVASLTQLSYYFIVLKLNCSPVWHFEVGAECNTCKGTNLCALKSKDVCNFNSRSYLLGFIKKSIMIGWVIKDRFSRRADWENTLCIAGAVQTGRRQCPVLTSFFLLMPRYIKNLYCAS